MKLLYLLPFILFGCTKKSTDYESYFVTPKWHRIYIMTDVCPNGESRYHEVGKEEYDKVHDQLTGDEDCVIVEFYSMNDNAIVSGWFVDSYAPN